MSLFWKKRNNVNFKERVAIDSDENIAMLMVRVARISIEYEERISLIEVYKKDNLWQSKITYV